mgnify:CR=1 FL=1
MLVKSDQIIDMLKKQSATPQPETQKKSLTEIMAGKIKSVDDMLHLEKKLEDSDFNMSWLGKLQGFKIN